MNRNVCLFVLTAVVLVACQSATPPTLQSTQGTAFVLPRVVAVESFLADIAQNVAGDRLKVETLIPLGVDPHSYQPTPQDVSRLAETDVLIVNGVNLEAFLDPLLKNAGGQRLIITASAGLIPRADSSGSHTEGDPHFWLDPNNVVRYAENIRDGLTQADPSGASQYASNASSYVDQLKILDQWIVGRVATIRPERRLLVTNHESLGYFADCYGFTLVGAIIPSLTTDASPTAQEMAGLIEQIRQTGAPAIFLDVGANPDLARQVAAETGIKVVTDLYLETLSAPDGLAPNYIMMMRHDVDLLVAACAT